MLKGSFYLYVEVSRWFIGLVRDKFLAFLEPFFKDFLYHVRVYIMISSDISDHVHEVGRTYLSLWRGS